MREAGLQEGSGRRYMLTAVQGCGIGRPSSQKEMPMRTNARRTMGLALVFALVAGGAFWVSSSLSAAPGKPMLPTKEATVECAHHPEDCTDGCSEGKTVFLEGLGTFETRATSSSPLIARVGRPFQKNGLKTVPLQLLNVEGMAFAEGVGETRFWLDGSRPVTSAVWERSPGTEFPAIQEMRFHFFYTVEALPGKVYRSMNPVVMRTENLPAFPPPAGTRYHLSAPVYLEEVGRPGVVVGKVVDNEVRIPKPRQRDPRQREPEIR